MKCINCGGTLRYDIEKYGLVCDHCGSFKPLHKPEEGIVSGDMDFEAALRAADRNWGVTRRLVECKSCGAKMLYSSDLMSGLCPFCGSSIVLSAEEADCGVAPTAIIPFSITKEEVAQRFYRWNKFAIWSPEKFRNGKVLGNLTPIYIPYWTFEADTVTTYTGNFGYTTGSGENERTRWERKSGVVESHIGDHRVCGSRRFASDKMLHPVTAFKPEDLMPYDPEILAGMPAEIYTVGLGEAWNKAKCGGMQKRIMNAICGNEHADHYKELKYSTEFSNIRYKYVLVPVWLTGCRFRGQIYNVAASGQNGRGNCKRPVSVAKFVCAALIFVALMILGTILFRTPAIAIVVAMPLLFVGFIIYLVMFFTTLGQQRDEDRQKAARSGQ